MNGKKYRWRVVALIFWIIAVVIAISSAISHFSSGGFTWQLLFDFLIVTLFTKNVVEKWQSVKEARRQIA